MASTTGDGEFGFQIAPMLDVLFVLLLFFMVAAGAQKLETHRAVLLPGRAGPELKIPVTLQIADDGQVIFNGASTDAPEDHQLPETMSRLKAVLTDAPERQVIIAPSATTRHQRVMDVLNLCKAVHVRNISFGFNSD